jgi:Domain of unknown function (DUF6989)
MILQLDKTVKKAEFWFMLITLIIVLAVGYISSVFRLGWKSAAILSYGMYCIILLFAFITSDYFLKKLLLFSIMAGFTELLADCWLVRSTQTLVYASHEPMIACSPLYMPFSWAVILMQIGYLGWLIAKEEKLIVTILITAILGAGIIPLFENWAKNAQWWWYQHTIMIGNTPYYIIGGEALLCAMLPVFFTIIFRKHLFISIIFGISEGLCIWLSYFIFYEIFK